MARLRNTVMATALGLLAAGASAGDIVDVLRHSHDRRLATMPETEDGARAAVVRRSFERVMAAAAPDVPVQLRVVSAGTVAETLHGRIVVVHESLALMPEGVRLFVLAHELGHVIHRHWMQVGLLYKRWVPGEVVPEKTDPVAGALGRAASGQAHRHEFEADAFALGVLRRLGGSPQDAVAAFIAQGVQHDTATHPGTRKRIAFLRAAEAGALPPSGADAE